MVEFKFNPTMARKWRPCKATKIEVLTFIRERKVIVRFDLVERFGLKPSSAKWRLWTLAKQGLIEPLDRGSWSLRLDYYGRL